MLIILNYSCAVKKENQISQSAIDSDGDGIEDQQERKMGRNPIIADLPELEINFLQNYSILVRYLDGAEEKIFTLDTNAGRGQSEFKYRVGELMARNLAFREAARIGKFSNHHFGEFAEQNLTWIQYPQIDEKFYLSFINNFNPDWDIKNISVILENSVKLKDNRSYDSIKNLELNFYYYDHELENYVHIGMKRIERHFLAGVNETFTVKFDNIPLNLVRDSYFWRGEFIISEIKDFEIPQIKATYRKLLSSVKEKAIPVVYNTPLKSKVYYVSLGEKGEKNFHEILKSIFSTQFTIVENELEKINQFTNNLNDYTYLQEIKENYKNGRWFVFTNPINRHYLDYTFNNQDKIALSYITGNVLARQKEEVIQHYGNYSTQDKNNFIILGEASANSQVHILISPLQRWGKRSKFWDETVQGGGNCGKNCLAIKPYECELKFSSFKEYLENFSFKDNLNEEFSRINLVINKIKFNLKKMIEEQKIFYQKSDKGIHIYINNLAQLKEMESSEENTLALEITPISKTVFNGVFLEKWHGSTKKSCIPIALNATIKHRLPISVQSLDFNKWKHWINPELTEIGQDKTYGKNFSIKISTLIINLFN